MLLQPQIMSTLEVSWNLEKKITQVLMYSFKHEIFLNNYSLHIIIRLSKMAAVTKSSTLTWFWMWQKYFFHISSILQILRTIINKWELLQSQAWRECFDRIFSTKSFSETQYYSIDFKEDKHRLSEYFQMDSFDKSLYFIPPHKAVTNYLCKFWLFSVCISRIIINTCKC